MIKNLIIGLCPGLSRYYAFIMVVLMMLAFSTVSVEANNATNQNNSNNQNTQNNAESNGATNIWTKANELIVDIYNQIVGISTVLAGLMSAVAVIGAKMSNNQHKVDQAWDWLRRIWIAWAVINGIGAFIAFVRPAFEGLSTIE